MRAQEALDVVKTYAAVGSANEAWGVSVQQTASNSDAGVSDNGNFQKPKGRTVRSPCGCSRVGQVRQDVQTVHAGGLQM